jgi:hypothetical protein
MTFVLIIQIAAELSSQRLEDVENDCAEALDRDGAIDGHDSGHGESNIFIVTAEPDVCFEKCTPVLANHQLAGVTRAAYRAIDSDLFTVVYPTGLDRFVVS